MSFYSLYWYTQLQHVSYQWRSNSSQTRHEHSLSSTVTSNSRPQLGSALNWYRDSSCRHSTVSTASDLDNTDVSVCQIRWHQSSIHELLFGRENCQRTINPHVIILWSLLTHTTATCQLVNSVSDITPQQLFSCSVGGKGRACGGSFTEPITSAKLTHFHTTKTLTITDLG